MKKLLTVTCLAGLLSIPSVVFADEAVPEEAMSDEAMAEEAMPAEPEISPEMQGHIGDSHSGPVWYGSIRVGVASDRGADGVESFGSRWGVQGSSEISEGLTAVYNFEESLDAGIATVEDNGRLSYVGLSGGFGTITAGQVWSATYNTVGSITDKSTAYGDSGAYLRLGNAISYAVSVGNLSMQADAILDSGKAGNTVDHLEFGVSMDVGDIGKIAFAHRRIEDYTTSTMVDTYTSTSKVMESAVIDSVHTITGGTVTNTLEVGEIKVEGDVPLSISGKLAAIEVEAKYPNDPAVLCVKNSVITKTLASTGCKADEETIVGDYTIDNTTKPKTIAVLPPIKLENTGTDTTGATGTIVTVDKIPYSVIKGKRWNKPTVCDSADATGECVESAYYYYEKTGSDGKVEKIPVTAGQEVTSNVNLDHTLTATGGALEGDLTVSDVDVDTTNTVTTDPVIKTTTEKDALQTAVTTTVAGETANFIAGQLTLGGITGYLGYTEVKTNGIDATDSTTHAGIRGSAGDTGVSYFVQLRNKETASPWLVGLSKTLGGGASLNFEYGDEDLADVDHRAGLWLQVDF